MNDVNNYYPDESLNIAVDKVLKKEKYFQEKELKINKIIKLMYNYPNLTRLKKWFLILIIKLLIKILKESLKNGYEIKLPKFGKFSVSEDKQNNKIILFKPHKDLLDIDNIYDLYIFKINILKDKSSVKYTYSDNIIDNKLNNKLYKKLNYKIPKTDKIKINLKKKILFNFENSKIENNAISLVTLAELIINELKIIRYNNSIIPRVIEIFFLIIKEAAVLGIMIEIENFGTFLPSIRKDERKNYKKNLNISYENGTIYLEEITGWRDIKFVPSEKLVKLVNAKKNR